VNHLINSLLIIVMVASGSYLLYSAALEPAKPFSPIQEAKQCVLVNTVLEHAMEAMKADRAYLFQFHNGTHAGSRQFVYYSNTHEVCGLGISSEMLGLQRIPLSMLAPSWLPIMEKTKSFYRKTQDEPHNQTRLILEKQGIKSVAISRLLYMGELIGFIGVDYVREEPDNIDMHQLDEAASIIQTLITGNN